MVRERHYDNPELARRLEEWLVDYFKIIDINSSRRDSRVFFSLKGIEYAAVFGPRKDEHMFCFHVENPSNELITDMQASLKSDAIFRTHDVLSRPKFKDMLPNYTRVFERRYVGSQDIYLEDKIIPSAVSVARIKSVPLGQEGRISENFFEWTFDYNMRPVILLAQKHKFSR